MLELTRERILAHRRRVGALDERMPYGGDSLRVAARAGLQDSVRRAASLSLHARVDGTRPDSWEDPAVLQLWGPRWSVYVVAEQDRAVFSLGRLPRGGARLRRIEDVAARLRDELGDRQILTRDADRFLAPPGPVAPARLLPSGDPHHLAWGEDRELLVEDPQHRAELWTSRVWPGAVMIDGEVVGTWRRACHRVTVRLWHGLDRGGRDAIEAEAARFPLPGPDREVEVTWQDPA